MYTHTHKTTCPLMFCTRPPPHYHMQYPHVLYQTTTPLPHAISSCYVPDHHPTTTCNISVIMSSHSAQIPAFFAGHHSYDLYDPHMRYENQLWRYPWKGCGLLSYRLFLQGFRLALGGVASGLCTDLLRITKDAEEGKIEARWRVKGQYHCSRRQRYSYRLR